MTVQDSLKKGTIEMIALYLLAQQDMYGYQLRKEFEIRSNGYFILPDASLYPTLYRLVSKGFISEREEVVDRRLRRYYHLEEAGKKRLENTLYEYKRLQDGISSVFESSDSKD